MTTLHHAHSADEVHTPVCPKCRTQCPACPKTPGLKSSLTGQPYKATCKPEHADRPVAAQLDNWPRLPYVAVMACEECSPVKVRVLNR